MQIIMDDSEIVESNNIEPSQDVSSYANDGDKELIGNGQSVSKKRRCVRPPKKFKDYVDINKEDSIKPLISSIMQGRKKDKTKKAKPDNSGGQKDVWLLDLLPCSTYEYTRESSKSNNNTNNQNMAWSQGTGTFSSLLSERDNRMKEEPPDIDLQDHKEEDNSYMSEFLENRNNIELLQASNNFLGEHFMSITSINDPVKKPLSISHKSSPKPLKLSSRTRGKPGTGRALHVCFHCNYNSKSKAHLRTHVESVHLLLKKFSCNLCSYKGTQRCHLRQHIKAVHNKDRPFACTLCDYKATQKGHLKLHIDTVHEKLKPYGCNLCNFKSSLRCVVTKHVNDVHLRVKRYACELCDFKATRLRSLKAHMNSHSASKLDLSSEASHGSNEVSPKISITQTHTCGYCPFQTSYKHSLSIHIKSVHKNIKPYKCDKCDYTTSYRSSLSTHTKSVHLGLKPFSCFICGYQASLRHTIKTHIENVHKLVKHYTCDYCNYSVSMKHYLIKHIHSQHSVIM